MSKKIFKPGELVVYAPKNTNGEIYKTMIGKVEKMSENGNTVEVYFHENNSIVSRTVSDIHKIFNAKYILKTALNLSEE